MKKRISLLLAIVMIVTLLPMSVFAKAEYRVDRTPTVSDEAEFTAAGTTPPNLIIKLKDAVGAQATRDLTFRLSLENAEWDNSDGFLVNIGTGANSGQRNAYSTTLNMTGGRISFNVRRISSTVIELAYSSATGAAPGVDTEIVVPMHSYVVSSGDVTVTIDPRDSILSSGTYTYAVAGGGETKTMSSKTIDIQDAAMELEPIVIDELRPGTIKSGSHTITLKAPSGFVFTGLPTSINASGGLTGFSAGSSWDNDREEIYINYTLTAGTSSRGTITIAGIRIRPEDDARYGDVYLRISGGGVTNETFLVGTYREYGLSFEAEDKTLPVLVAGRFEGNRANNADADQQESAETLEVTLKENVEKSWWGGRKTEIKLPDGVKFRAVEIVDASHVIDAGGRNISSELQQVYYNNRNSVSVGSNGANVEVVNDKVTLSNMYVNDNRKAEMVFKFWVSIEPGFEGDLDVTLTGPAVAEDINATVATVISPITVEAKTTDVKIGYAGVAVNDITITENVAGAILKKVYTNSASDIEPLMLFADATNVNLRFANVDSFEVTEGDIEIDKVKVSEGRIYVYVKRVSDKPSTIVLKGVTMNIDRSVPEGPFPIRAGGGAIIANYEDTTPLNRSMFDVSNFAFPNIYKVITAAPDKTSTLIVEAIVDLNEPNVIKVSNGEVITMGDAAVYIENNRTMIPVAYVASALGIAQSNVIWDNTSKTVTIMRNNFVAQLQSNSNKIKVNGSEITMDTAMLIKDGRSYVPVAYVAMALGIPYNWDDATRTVTFNPLSETVKSSATN